MPINLLPVQQQFYLIDETDTKAQFLVTLGEKNYEVTVKKGKEERGELEQILKGALANPPRVGETLRVEQEGWKVKIKSEKTGFPGAWRTVKKAFRRAFTFRNTEHSRSNFKHTADTLSALFNVKAVEVNFPQSKVFLDDIKRQIQDLKNPAHSLNTLKNRFNDVAASIEGLLRAQVGENYQQYSFETRRKNLLNFIGKVENHGNLNSPLVTKFREYKQQIEQLTKDKLPDRKKLDSLELEIFRALPEAWLSAKRTPEAARLSHKGSDLWDIRKKVEKMREGVRKYQKNPSPTSYKSLLKLLHSYEVMLIEACSALKIAPRDEGYFIDPEVVDQVLALASQTRVWNYFYTRK